MVEIRTDDLNNPRIAFALTDTVKAYCTDLCCRFLRWLHGSEEEDLIIVEG